MNRNMILFIEPPYRYFGRKVDSEKGRAYRNFPLLACGIGLAYGLALTFPPVRQLLEFPPYPLLATIVLFIIAAIWVISFQTGLRYRLGQPGHERFRSARAAEYFEPCRPPSTLFRSSGAVINHLKNLEDLFLAAPCNPPFGGCFVGRPSLIIQIVLLDELICS